MIVLTKKVFINMQLMTDLKSNEYVDIAVVLIPKGYV